MPTAQTIPAISTCTVSDAHRLLLSDIERQRTALRTVRKEAAAAIVKLQRLVESIDAGDPVDAVRPARHAQAHRVARRG